MTLSGQLLAAFALYGLPVLFGVVLLGSAGIPIPGVVVVLAAGAFVQQGELNQWWVLGLTCSAAILGDNVGYAIGRLGGRRLVIRLVRRFGGERRLHDAEALAKRWGALGIFLTRWLLTPFDSLLNFTSGMASYPYVRFLFLDIAGDMLWTIEYVLLGKLLSDRIATLIDLIGEVPWVVVGLIGAALFGRRIIGYFRTPHKGAGR